MIDLRAMGVPVKLEKAIDEAWNVVIPTDVTPEEFWQMWIAKDRRLVELYTELYERVPPGLMGTLILDARSGRRESIRDAERALREIAADKQRAAEPHVETAGQS